MKTDPCYECEKRYVGCHADCDDYKEWKARQQTATEAKHKDRRRQGMLNSYTMQEVAKNTRKKRKER